MNKNEKNQMKSVIKPLIKECLHEIMLEEGLIRMVKEHIVKEDVQKYAKQPESKSFIRQLAKESVEDKQEVLKEFKKKVAPVGFNPFAGTEDIDTMEAKGEQKKGVNIDKLFDNDMINSWNQQLDILQGKKE